LEGDLPRVGGEESFSFSSGKPVIIKSISWTGGAGAEGEIVALNGEGRDVLPNMRVGAVDPDNKAFLPSFPFTPEGLDFFMRPPSRPWFEALACCWAAFLFFRSMDILWPGRIWARAHLWPNLQFPFTNQVQTSFWPGSTEVWEKGQADPAVHDPTLKNLQGTCERSFPKSLSRELVGAEEKKPDGWDNTFGRGCFGLVVSFLPCFFVIVTKVGIVGIVFGLCWTGH
jgi:hypothetical protein